jgi:hypothetical protein
MEIVHIAGNDEELTDAALDAFVESFPVEDCQRAVATDIGQ